MKYEVQGLASKITGKHVVVTTGKVRSGTRDDTKTE